MEELAKAWGMECRPDAELQQVAAAQRAKYTDRFQEEIMGFDEADRDRYLYYRAGDAWVCTEFIECFEGVNRGLVRVLNGRLLVSAPDEGCLDMPWSIEEFHENCCRESDGRWFVNLPKL